MISIDKSKICEILAEIGLKEGDTVLIHSSIGLIFGNHNNPAELLFSALRETLTTTGTIIVPTFTFAPCSGSIFDINSTKSEVGEFSNYILSLDDVKRSFHPIHSVAAIGPNATYVTNHESLSSFGENSSYKKIIELKAYILLIGAGINYLSLIHQVEEDLKVPYRFYKDFNITVKEEDGYNNLTVPYYAKYLDRAIEYDYKKRELILIQSNALNTIKLGWGNIKFGLANEIYSVLHEKVCNDELFFINKEKYNAK
jgi:aminoglycoside 3-N-acetyltransferase